MYIYLTCVNAKRKQRARATSRRRGYARHTHGLYFLLASFCRARWLLLEKSSFDTLERVLGFKTELSLLDTDL